MNRCISMAFTLTFSLAFSMALVTGMTACSTPTAIPTKYDLPTILDLELPHAQRAILKHAKDRDDQLPENSLGEQIVIRAIKQRNRSVEELDAGGNTVTMDETIDSVAYVFRPARDTFILAVGGRVVRTPVGGGSALCAWFAYQGRYSNEGEIIEDHTSYLENADLFIDAMRSTANQVPWNTSAWAITRIYLAVVDAKGEEAANAMVDRFVKDALATDRARVPSGMTPRQAAFGGVKSIKDVKGKSSALPPASK